MKPLKKELQDRWLLYQFTSDDIFEKLDKWWVNFYLWFDPSADSLHLWNFIGFMVSVHIMRRWNTYTALTWGATGMIWDPWGKDSERNFLSESDLKHNQESISNQISDILKNLENYTWDKFKYSFVNNKDFYTNMWYLDFLREVWKYITVNVMISKDSVKKRIEDPKKSISYTEFSYMLLQWYDFAKMYKEDNMLLQIWWQDQWWNLVTWTEIIRKKYEDEAYALTWPLITDSTWRKFGKSEWNAMFLDEDKTSPYFIYQYFMNTSDEDLEKYMKMLTLIETEDIDKIVDDHLKVPEKRSWQKLLAFKIIEIIHNKQKAELCEKIANFMFSENKIEILKKLSIEDLQVFQSAVWGKKYENEDILDLLTRTNLSKSRGEWKKDISSWAIYLNEIKVSSPDLKIDFENWFLLLRKWKKKYSIITN